MHAVSVSASQATGGNLTALVSSPRPGFKRVSASGKPLLHSRKYQKLSLQASRGISRPLLSQSPKIAPHLSAAYIDADPVFGPAHFVLPLPAAAPRHRHCSRLSGGDIRRERRCRSQLDHRYRIETAATARHAPTMRRSRNPRGWVRIWITKTRTQSSATQIAAISAQASRRAHHPS